MFYRLRSECLGAPPVFAANDSFYLLTISFWAKGGTFLGYRVDFEDWDLMYNEDAFSLKQVDMSRGPGGYPATAIYIKPSGRFPKEEFLRVFRKHSGDGLPRGLADWVIRTMESYEGSGESS